MGLQGKRNLSLAAVFSLDTRWRSGHTDQQMYCSTQETCCLYLIATLVKTDVPINVLFEFFSFVKYSSP